MAKEDKYADELLSDEELDNVASGTVKEFTELVTVICKNASFTGIFGAMTSVPILTDCGQSMLKKNGGKKNERKKMVRLLITAHCNPTILPYFAFYTDFCLNSLQKKRCNGFAPKPCR